ncbi:MAG: SRPBCC family protein [Vicinamibacterales bacterium]
MGRLTTSLVVPRPHADVFAFFADAANLQRITPPWVDFRIVTPLPIAMRAGTLIDYRLKIRGVPIGWRTEISAWDPPHHFVDEQVQGPYRRWVHTHRFRAVEGGTAVEDEVDFRAPGGWLVERLFVARDVGAIFRYRQQAIFAAFGLEPGPPADVRID